jgi:F-type H+-transporting ATPase subunit delta
MTHPEALPTRIATVLDDPGHQAVARVYAEAFLDAVPQAETNGNIDGALEEFGSFVDDVLTSQPRFAAILTSEVVSRDEKLGLIDRVVAPRGSALFTNFLRVLARHDRLDLLPLILRQARRLHMRRSGLRGVTVRSARPLSDEQQNQIRDRLRASLPFEPVLQTEVEPALLGGLVIQIGDTVYDSSLRSRMKQLRRRLRTRSQNEVQRARDRFRHHEGNSGL